MELKCDLTRSFFIAGILLLFFLSFSQAVYADIEVIDNFEAKIVIQKDGSLLIIETIVYNFGSNQKHGIFRDLPLTAVNGPQLSIDILDVSNELGQRYQYIISTTNDILRVKIGNPDMLVSGRKTYIISYQVYNAIRTFDDHNELYWNITGNQWSISIRNVVASIILPDPSMTNVRMDCFTGLQKSTQKNCAFNSGAGQAEYSTTQLLNANEGMTIVLGMPLGYIDNVAVAPTVQSRSDNSATSDLDDLFISFCFAVFLLAIIGFFIRRRLTEVKPKPVIPKELKNQPVVVEYNPPDNLPPIEIGTLLDRRVDLTDISSVIMDLAVWGYLKIRYAVQQIRFWPDKKDFELIKLKDGSDLVQPADKIMFDLLFSGRDRVKLSDLKQRQTTFQAEIKRIRIDTEQQLRCQGYFSRGTKDKSKKFGVYLFIVAAIFLFKFFMDIFQIDFLFFILAIILAPAIFSLIRSSANKLTPQGVAALAKILGFREFLQLVEKDKLKLLNAPELRPEMFEKFLPYAMVLGVERQWAQKFEGIYNTTPNWYEDPTMLVFSSYILVNNLSHFDNSFNQVFKITSPRSSSGFSSGFSGGFSGGGSGGGGGGSW